MPRPLRLEFPGAYYHIMNRGLEKRRIAIDDRDHGRFIALLEDIWQRWQVKIFAYCLMGNHYHIFLQTPLGNLSRVMRHVDGLYTQHFNRAHLRDGPLLRGRYKAVIVDADSYLLQLVRYIHLNPVKAGLVSDPSSYPWSSHRLYSNPISAVSWLARADILSNFSSSLVFEEFVAHGNDRSLDAFYNRKRFSPFLGSESFVSGMLKSLKNPSSTTRQERTPQFPDLQSLIERLSNKMAVPAQNFLVGQPGRENILRNVAIYVASRKAGFAHADICRNFGMTTVSAVSQVCRKLEKKLPRDANLGKILEAMVS